jgi:hypothetical protein
MSQLIDGILCVNVKELSERLGFSEPWIRHLARKYTNKMGAHKWGRHWYFEPHKAQHSLPTLYAQEAELVMEVKTSNARKRGRTIDDL